MTNEERQEIKNSIEKQILDTESLIIEYKEAKKPVSPDVAIGRISRMDAINNKSVTDASLFAAENKWVRLKNALHNINNSDFGLCIKCHKAIPYRRLLLLPDSLRCVECS